MLKSAVIFDMDGVLVDSHRHNLRAINRVLERHGLHLSKIPDPHKQDWKGGSFQDLLDAIRAMHGVDLDIETFAQEVDRLQFESMTFDTGRSHHDLRLFLRTLKERDIKIGLCSSSRKNRITKTLQLLEIDDCFDVIVSAEDVTEHKPAPHCYLLAAQLLDVPTANCMVIEDSLAGVIAAKEAGMKVVGFSMYEKDAILLSHIDFHARHYTDLNIDLVHRLTSDS